MKNNKLNKKENHELKYRLQYAEALESQDKFLHALQIYDKLIDKFPDDLAPYLGLARVYEKLDNKEAGINLLYKLIENDPTNRELRLQLGQFLFRNSQWNETIEVLSYFLPKDEPMVSFFIGYSHFMLKEYELAKISFENFISSDIKSDFVPDAYIFLAKINIFIEDFNSALDYLNKADFIYKNYYELHLLFAIVYLNIGMYEHAIASIEKSISFNTFDNSVFSWAGKIFLAAGNYNKAENLYLKFIEKSENVDFDTYFNIGIISIQLDKMKEAYKYMKLAIQLEPENEKAKVVLKDLSKLIEDD